MAVPARIKAIASMIFVMLIWGSSFAVTKNAVHIISPMLFAFLRFFTASVGLQIMLWLRPVKKTPARQKIPFAPLFWMGLSGVGLFYIFFNYSLLYTTASMGALLQAFIPVVIALLAYLFLKEPVTRKQTVSILVSVAGVILVAFVPTASVQAPHPVLGNILMLISVVCWAIYTIVSKKLADKDVLKVTAYSTYIGTLLLLPSVVVELSGKHFPHVPFSVWMSVIYLGALGSAICYFLYNLALKDLPASVVGIFINLDPVIGAAIAVIFLKEKIFLIQVIGSILVLAGMWLSSQKQSQTSLESNNQVIAP